jgi:hypothetical protein
MKTLSTSLFFAVLVSLFFLAIPSNALAQSSGDDPCCFIVPSSDIPFTNDGIQVAAMTLEKVSNMGTSIHSHYLDSQAAPSFVNSLELQVKVQSESGLKSFLAETGIANLFPVRKGEMYCGGENNRNCAPTLS